MININLLPWRQHQRKVDKDAFNLITIILIVLTIIILILFHALTTSTASKHNNTTKAFTLEYQRMNTKIALMGSVPEQLKEIQQKINIFNTIHHQQIRTHELIDMLSEATPKNIVIRQVQLKNDEITISAFSPNNEAITKFIDNINKNIHFSNATISESKVSDENNQHTILVDIKCVFASKQGDQ